MSMAWETTIDDVLTVCEKLGIDVNDEQAELIHSELDTDEIEKAALYGDDMDDQVTYAYDEIEKQIKNMKFDFLPVFPEK